MGLDIFIAGTKLPLADLPDAFSVEDVPYLAGVLREGDPRYLTQAISSAVAWSDLSGGIGPADYLYADRYWYTFNVDCRFRGYSFLSGLVQAATVAGMPAASTLFRQFAPGRAWATAGARVYTTTTGLAWTASLTSAASNVLSLAELDGTVLAAVGASEDYWYSTNNGTSWQQPTTTGTRTKPSYLVTGRDATGFPVVAALYSDNTLWTTTNPGTASPSFTNPTLTTTSTTAAPTGLFFWRGYLMAMQTDGVYRVNLVNGEVLRVFGSEAMAPDPGPAVACSWPATGKFYFAFNGGWYAYDGVSVAAALSSDTLRSLGFEHQQESDSPLRGRYVAAYPSDRWLWVVLESNETTPRYHVLCFDERSDGSPVWHSTLYLGSDTCTAIGWFQGTSSTSQPYLLLGQGASGLAYVVQPRGTHLPLADTAYRYTGQGLLYLPAHYGRSPQLTKYGLSAETAVQQLNNAAGITVAPGYSLDGGPRQSLGQVPSDGASLAYPNTSTTTTSYWRLAPSLFFQTSDATTTPVVRAFTHEYEAAEAVQFVHHIKLALPPVGQAATNLGPRKIWDLLATWRTQKPVVTYTDVEGRAQYARVTHIGKTAVTLLRNADPVYYVPVTIKLLRPSGTGRRYYYNRGATYNSGTAGAVYA